MSTKLAKLIEAIPVVSDAAARDLRFPSPDLRQRIQRLDTGDVEIHDGTGWGVLRPQGFYGPVYNLLDYRPNRRVDIGDGVNDATTIFQDAFDDVPEGSALYVPPPANFYKLTDKPVIEHGMLVRGERSKIQQTVAAKGGFGVTGSEVELYGLDLEGKQHVDLVTDERGLDVLGESSDPIQGLIVRGCRFHGWGEHGLHKENCQNFEVSLSRFYDCVYAGIISLSCQQGSVYQNKVWNITGNPLQALGTRLAYGITFSRHESFDLVEAPLATDILCALNELWDIQWEGCDTHGGRRIKFIANILYHCFHGVVATPSDNQVNVATYAPMDVTIAYNDTDTGVDDGTYGSGITVSGAGTATVVELATGCKVVENTVRRAGRETIPNEGAALFQYTKGLIVAKNHVIEGNPQAMSFNIFNYDADCEGNYFTDPWNAGGQAYSAAIKIAQKDNTVRFRGNHLIAGNKSGSPTHLNDKGLYVATTTNVVLHVGGGNDFAIAATPYSGGGTVTIYDDAETIDGFAVDNVAGTVGDTELQRNGGAAGSGRWRPTRAGSIVGILVTATEARTLGTLTVKAFKNTGLSGAAGSQLGSLTAALGASPTSEVLSLIERGTLTFAAFDEIWPTYTTSGWTPTTSDLRVAFMVVYDT